MENENSDIIKSEYQTYQPNCKHILFLANAQHQRYKK